MAESLVFDVLARGNAADVFAKTGLAAGGASDKVKGLSRALDGQARQTDVLAAATLASAKADRIFKDAQDEAIASAVEARIALERQASAAKKSGESSGAAAGRLSALAGTGGIPGGGMGAAVAAGFALSPVLITVGAGLTGLGIAAAGTISPIIKASQSAGGLQKAMAKLDPEQRAAAKSLMVLKGNYTGFENALKPVVLHDFSAGVTLAGHVLKEIQPVTTATGKAFGGFIGQIDQTLSDPQWTGFWAFMARTAPQDVQLLGSTITSLANDIPPLVEALQPLATGLLTVTTDAAKATGGIEGFLNTAENKFPLSSKHTFSFLRDLDKWTVDLTNKIPGLRSVNDAISGVQRGVSGSGNAAAAAAPHVSDLAGVLDNAAIAAQQTAENATQAQIAAMKFGQGSLVKGIFGTGDAFKFTGDHARIMAGSVFGAGDMFSVAGSKAKAASFGIFGAGDAFRVTGDAAKKDAPILHGYTAIADAAGRSSATAAQDVTQLNTAFTAGLAPLLAYSGALITQKDDAHALAQALRKSHDQIGLQTGAQRASFSAANTYIGDLETTAAKAQASGHGIGAEITMLQNALPALESAKSHSKLYWQEVRTLVSWLDRLKAERVSEKISITGSGRWAQVMRQGGGSAGHATGAAEGWRVPGFGGGDRVPALLEGGETVVPKHLTPAVAPLMKAHGVPGFATGGIVPSYGGALAGLKPWAAGNVAATDQQIMTALVRSLGAAAPIPGGGVGAGGAGVRRWAGTALAALTMLGQPPGDLGVVLSQMATESGGNPLAVNLTDSNAAAGTPSVGLMQVIGPTFASYAGPFRRTGPFAYGVSENPLANIFAGLNYATHRYGPGWTNVLGHGHGYDSGGWLPTGLSLAYNGTGRPEAVIPPAGRGRSDGGALLAELRKMNGLLADIADAADATASHTASGPARTASGVQRALGGSARAGAYRQMYSARG